MFDKNDPEFRPMTKVMYLGSSKVHDDIGRKKSHAELVPGQIYTVLASQDDYNKRWVILSGIAGWRYENVYFCNAPFSDNWKRFLIAVLAN